MEEGVFGLSDIDKGSFDAGFMILNLAFEDGTDHLLLVRLFDFKFLKDAIFEECHSALQRFRIDDEFFERIVGLLVDGFGNPLKERLLLFAFSGFYSKLLF